MVQMTTSCRIRFTNPYSDAPRIARLDCQAQSALRPPKTNPPPFSDGRFFRLKKTILPKNFRHGTPGRTFYKKRRIFGKPILLPSSCQAKPRRNRLGPLLSSPPDYPRLGPSLPGHRQSPFSAPPGPSGLRKTRQRSLFIAFALFSGDYSLRENSWQRPLFFYQVRSPR